MEKVLYIIFILFTFEHFVLFFGLMKNIKKPKENDFIDSNPPFISIIVAARNEELVIENCIKSLIELNYEKDKIEIFLVNDRSTDDTGIIMQKYTSPINQNIKYLEISEASTELKGKSNALSRALDIAKGEIIFTTDADIEVKPSWIKEILKYYKEDTGVVNGFSIMRPNSFNAGFQSMDWIYLLSIASGSAGLNLPISCVGNNMSYRRKAYDEVGGYKNIKFSVTEDFMLLQTIKNETNWQTKFPVNNSCLNWTLPCSSFKELYRQKKRWTKGGLDAKWPGISAGILAWRISFGMIFGWTFLDFKIYLFLFFFKILVDLLFTLPAIKIFKVFRILLFLIPFEIYYSLYVFLAPFIVLFDKEVVWKEQKL